MLRIFFLSVTLCYSLFIQGQLLHTPANIKQIQEGSSLNYVLIPTKLHIQQLSLPIRQAHSIFLSPVKTEGKAKKYHKKALKSIKKKNQEAALSWYDKAFKLAPKNYPLLIEYATYCSQIEQFDKANLLYEIVFFDFPQSYKIHQLLAKNFVRQKNYEKARYHATLAHLFNRNDPQVYQQLLDLSKLSGDHFQTWSFRPNYQLQFNEKDQEVQMIYTDSVWLGYINCKAVWKFEPDYAERMKLISDNPIEIIEEKECLLNAVLANERLESPYKDPTLIGLAKAIEYKFINEFILYEQCLREQPELILERSNEELNALMQYLKLTHINKK